MTSFHVLLLILICRFVLCASFVTKSYLQSLANEYISNLFWSFRNVSFKNNILYLHNMNKADINHLTVPVLNKATKANLKGELPWKATFPFQDIKIVDWDLDFSQCSTVEKRRVTFSRFNDISNVYSSNQGHFVINILNPLLLYLYFVDQNHANMQDVVPANLKFPLKDYLLLYDGTLSGHRSPVYLFDFITSFMEHVEPKDSYFRAKNDNQMHCFTHLDLPGL